MIVWLDYRYGWRWLLPLRNHDHYGESTMHIETELDDGEMASLTMQGD